MPAPISNLKRREAAKLYKKGINSITVGKILRIDAQSVLNHARAAGVKIRCKNAPRPKAIIRECVRQYKSGYTQAEIAKRRGCTQMNISAILRKAGCKMRGAKQAKHRQKWSIVHRRHYNATIKARRAA